MNRKAIALLITLFFVIAITVSIGVGLKLVNKASSEVQSENFMLQTSLIVDDILTILKKSEELDSVLADKSSSELFAFLSQASSMPINRNGIRVSLELKSARGRINPNILMSSPTKVNSETVNALKQYLNKYNINSTYVDTMLDMMGGVKEDLSYNSEIFYDKSDLFRDYIVSRKHLGEIDDFYKKRYHDNSLENVNFENLFYFSADKNSSIDLNYASGDVWELMLGCTKERAQTIALGAGSWSKVEDISLKDDEKGMLAKFSTSFFEPYLEVVVKIVQRNSNAKVRFEYDMTTKQGRNFSYDI